MRHVVSRDLLVSARSAGLWSALVLHVLLVGAFVAVWGHGLPIHGAPGIEAQFTLLDTMILCVLLPWAAVRSSPPSPRLHVTATAVATATSAGAVLVSRLVAQAAALIAVALAPLPVLLVVQAIASRPAMDVVWSIAGLSALAGVAAVLADAASMFLPNRLSAWLVATVVTGLVAAVPGAAGLATRSIVCLGGAAILAGWAENQLRYATGRRAPCVGDVDTRQRESNAGRSVA